MMAKGKNRLDDLSRLLTLEEAGRYVKRYLNKGISRKGAALFLVEGFAPAFSVGENRENLPVDVIKLDREFFTKKLNRREKVVISNVIHMAKELDIQVISEGIETEEHEHFLEEIDCDLAQGCRYGRPGPIEQYLPMLYGDERRAADDIRK